MKPINFYTEYLENGVRHYAVQQYLPWSGWVWRMSDFKFKA